MMSFESDPEAYQANVPSLGCGGSIEVLVERFTPDHLLFLRQLAAAHEMDHASVAVCEIDLSGPAAVKVKRTLFTTDASAMSLAPQLFRLFERAISEERSIESPIGAEQRAMERESNSAPGAELKRGSSHDMAYPGSFLDVLVAQMWPENDRKILADTCR